MSDGLAKYNYLWMFQRNEDKNDDFNKLSECVSRVRSELEQPEVRNAFIGFFAFPAGSCMDASLLLGYVIHQKGFGDPVLVWGSTAFSTHSWLELDKYVIDITADQFAPGINTWIVKKGAQGFPWQKFKVEGRVSVTEASIVPDGGFYQVLNKVLASFK